MIMLFAAEVATDTGYFVLVDKSRDALYVRLNALIAGLADDTDFTDAVGHIECDDIDKAIDRIRAGDWEYSQWV